MSSNTNKIVFFYFSGTGNTLWAVSVLSEKLKSRGLDCETISCEEDVDFAFLAQSADALGIAFPIYASFAPKVFQKLLDKLPETEGKLLFGLTTAGFLAGDVLWHAAKPLRRRGYVPKVLYNIVLGNNMHLPGLSPLRVTGEEKLKENMDKADQKLDKMAADIAAERKRIRGAHPLGRFFGFIQRSISGKLEEKVFHGFHADSTCVRCGWCVKNCPVECISQTGEGIHFGEGCNICLRCYSYCPEEAIQLTEKTKDREKYKRYTGPLGKIPKKK